MILARTLKGKGVSFVEGKDGWHGKALKKGEEADAGDRRARGAVRAETTDAGAGDSEARAPPAPKAAAGLREGAAGARLQAGRQVATREAYGTALAELGAVDARVVALDADVKNSTFSDQFEKVHPDRFYQNFIAEQVMVGAAMGLAARGAIPFPSTFACFLERAQRLHPHGRHQQPRTSSWPARTPACRSARTARRRWRSRIWR